MLETPTGSYSSSGISEMECKGSDLLVFPVLALQGGQVESATEQQDLLLREMQRGAH